MAGQGKPCSNTHGKNCSQGRASGMEPIHQTTACFPGCAPSCGPCRRQRPQRQTLLLQGNAAWGQAAASFAHPAPRSGPAGAVWLCETRHWENNLFLKHLTGFWRPEPDGKGLSGEGILVPRLGVRVLVGLFHRHQMLPAAE